MSNNRQKLDMLSTMLSPAPVVHFRTFADAEHFAPAAVTVVVIEDTQTAWLFCGDEHVEIGPITNFDPGSGLSSIGPGFIAVLYERMRDLADHLNREVWSHRMAADAKAAEMEEQ